MCPWRFELVCLQCCLQCHLRRKPSRVLRQQFQASLLVHWWAASRKRKRQGNKIVRTKNCTKKGCNRILEDAMCVISPDSSVHWLAACTHKRDQVEFIRNKSLYVTYTWERLLYTHLIRWWCGRSWLCRSRDWGIGRLIMVYQYKWREEENANQYIQWMKSSHWHKYYRSILILSHLGGCLGGLGCGRSCRWLW